VAVITVASRKGGVGKSTLTVNCAAALAELGGRVLLCDLDPQAASSLHLGVDYMAKDTLAEVLLGEAPLEAVLTHTQSGVDVAPGSPMLAAAEARISQQVGREAVFREIIDPIRADYDWILVDTPPSLGVLSLNAIVAGDYVLIPALPEAASVEAVAQTLETVEEASRRFRLQISVLGAVANRYQGRVRSHGEILERLEGLGIRVFRARVRQTVRLAEAFMWQEPMLARDPHHPASEDIRAVTREMVHYVG
jgi:chromosome partitioning protein